MKTMNYYFLNAEIMIFPTNTRNTMTTNKANGIHRGDVTHHHDQSILSNNLSTRNIRNNIVPIPIPLPVLLDELIFTP